MFLAASPKVVPVDKSLLLEEEEWKMVKCEVWGFYPKEIDIGWRRHPSVKGDEMENLGCEKPPHVFSDSDGTFRTVCVLKLKPTGADDGATFECHVRHQMLTTSHSEIVTINILKYYRLRKMAWFIPLTVLLILGVFGGYGYFHFQTILRKALACFPKDIIRIDPPSELIHGQQTSVKCWINFLQWKSITVYCYIIKDGEELKIMEKTLAKSADEGTPLSVLRGFSVVRLEVGFCRDFFSLTFHASAKEHNGAEFVCELRRNTSPLFKRSFTMQVKGAPRAIELQGPSKVNHGKEVTVKCSVYGLFPKRLTVSWYLRMDGQETRLRQRHFDTDERSEEADPPGDENPVYTQINPTFADNEDRTANFQVEFSFQADVMRHRELEFICEVSHEALKEPLRKTTAVQVKSGSSLLSSIISSPLKNDQDQVTLSCMLTTNDPISVTWYRKRKKDRQNLELVTWSPPASHRTNGTSETSNGDCRLVVRADSPNNTGWVNVNIGLTVAVSSEMDDRALFSCKVTNLTTSTSEAPFYQKVPSLNVVHLHKPESSAEESDFTELLKTIYSKGEVKKLMFVCLRLPELQKGILLWKWSAPVFNLFEETIRPVNTVQKNIVGFLIPVCTSQQRRSEKAHVCPPEAA
ncbi:uncharacterized protein LOC102348311 [Latimeria chalumnae]|uniref:uncharacterized protein LOC102348311 n=1 Tax=Latimeria chalumnae TaxID=7897 RepID=UPI00313D1A98